MTYRTYSSKRILVTSGPTCAPLDTVRYLTNRSTGRFGTLLAQAALQRGVSVTMIYGVGSETPRPHPRLRLISVETNRDLEQALKRELTGKRYEAVIHAMAVLDFQPLMVRRGKVGSRSGDWRVRLVPTKKIICQIKQWSPKTSLVGFKLEDRSVSRERLLSRARRLQRDSKADWVVANQLDSGDDKTHLSFLIDQTGRLQKCLGKQALAQAILALILL